TRRPRTTGMDLMRRSSMSRPASATSASSGRAITSRVIASAASFGRWAGRSAGGMRWARGSGASSKGTRSASDTMPTSSPSSTTGTALIPSRTSRSAPSLSRMSGGTVTTGLDITSLTRTVASLQRLWPFWPGSQGPSRAGRNPRTRTIGPMGRAVRAISWHQQANEEDPMHSLVKDLMTTQVVTVGPATPFTDLVARLAEHRVSAVPVVDDARRVLGVVSEADLLLKEEFPDPDQDLPLLWTKRRRLEREKAAGATARDLMSVALVSISPDATEAEAARRMHPPMDPLTPDPREAEAPQRIHRANIKRLPVIGEEGRLFGIVSRSDLLKV